MLRLSWRIYQQQQAVLGNEGQQASAAAASATAVTAAPAVTVTLTATVMMTVTVMQQQQQQRIQIENWHRKIAAALQPRQLASKSKAGDTAERVI